MTLKKLFNTFKYEQYVEVCGRPCGWCDDNLRTDVKADNIPTVFEPYLNNEVAEIDIYMIESGYYCGVVTETAIMEITIK